MVAGRALLSRGTVHVHDALSDAQLSPEMVAVARAWGFRTVISVPMLRDGQPIGALSVARPEVQPFSEAEIALLQTFADQAVIAIENVRLFNELEARNRDLTVALDQQPATSDILRVISRSQTDVQPVFDAIVTSAVRLLRAHVGTLTRVAGHQIALAALTSADAAGDAVLRASFPQPLQSEAPHARAIRDRVPVNIADAQADPVSEERRTIARARGYRSLATVPLLGHDEAVGTIGVARREPGGFTDDEIALLRTFADQAVIAIENVRLFTELQARNRDLTATGEILRVISTSPTDVQPVFDTIVETALRLLRGYSAGLTRVEGDQLVLCALTGTDDVGDAAVRAGFPRPVNKAIRDRAPVNIDDTHTDPRLAESWRPIARARGYHSLIEVPLLRQDEAIGGISVTRREPGGFTDDEIAVLKTFADQAVIAIENVRLFAELQASNRDLTTALDRQTATSEILSVISSSPTDVQPVFDAIVRSAVTLCGAILGAIYRRDGGLVRLVGLDPRYPHAEEVRATYPAPVTSPLMSCRAIHENAIIQLPDTEPPGVLPPEGLRLARLSGFRSVVAVPMRREGEPIGAILVGRPAVGAFPDEQIGLLQAFADQAVIAIENVRLFTELQEKNEALTQAHAQVSEALEQQTATSDVLRVISSSPTDVQPVFDSIAASALHLCNARLCTVFRFDGELIHLVALQQVSTEGAAAYRNAYPARPGRGGGTHRAILTGSIVHIPDIRDDPEYELQDLARANQFGCVLSVPMFRDGHPIGAITVGREATRSFSDAQIELLRTFADQAVIAIENVRLFNETKEALDQQTATGEILRVISSSPTDIQPVLDAIAATALRVCGATDAVIMRVEGLQVRRVAHSGPIQLILPEVRSITLGSPSGRAILECRSIHVHDAFNADFAREYPETGAVVWPRRSGHI